MEIPGNWHADFYGDDYARLVKGILTPERTAAEIEFILGATGISVPASIADIACGEGRHSLALAKRGFEVVGVDINGKFLEKAEREAKAGNIGAKFVTKDMRLPVAGTYDLAMSLYNSFGFFGDEENASMIADWAKYLKDGGLFLIDVWNRDAMLLNWKASRTWLLEDKGEVTQTSMYDHASGRVFSRYVFRDANGDDRDYMAYFRLYTAAELCAILKRCMLATIEIYGSLTGGPYEWNSERLVILAKKRPNVPVMIL